MVLAARLIGPFVAKAFSGEGLKIVERLKLTQEGLEMEYQVTTHALTSCCLAFRTCSGDIQPMEIPRTSFHMSCFSM